MKPRIALFDLDHTLLPIDSDHSWGEFTLQLGWVDATDFRARNDAFYADYQSGRLDIHDYVRFAMAAVCARGPQAAAQAHARFMHEVITPAIRQPALDLVARHRDAGDTLVLVTATNEFITRPIAQVFGIEDLIAVNLARDAQGGYTGEIVGTPSMREGKVERMNQWLAQRDWNWDDVQTTFYSDSSNDLPLLMRVNHPVATNPDERLRAVALDKGWPILNLFETA